MTGLTLAAATSWPDAAIAIAGVILTGAVTVVAVWQVLSTWRARINRAQEDAYRELAEQTARDLREIKEKIGAAEKGGTP